MATKIKCPQCDRKFRTTTGRDWHVQHIHNPVELDKAKAKEPTKAPLLPSKARPRAEEKRKSETLEEIINRLFDDNLNPEEREAKRLVRLADKGFSKNTLEVLVEGAMNRIQEKRNVNFDEAEMVLRGAIHKVRES